MGYKAGKDILKCYIQSNVCVTAIAILLMWDILP